MKLSFYVPRDLNLPSLLKKAGHINLTKPYHLDKFHFIIDYLYREAIFASERKQKKLSNYFPLHSKLLRSNIGSAFESQIKRLLLDLKIIQEQRRTDGKANYCPGKASKRFRLNRIYLNSGFRIVPVSDPKFVRRLERNRQNANQKAVRGDPGRLLIKRSVESIEFDSDKAQEYVQTKQFEKERAKQTREAIINTLRTRAFYFKTDKAGRFHHVLTVLPRDLRRFLSWQKQRLFAVDVANCQPALHATLYSQHCAERSHFIDLVSKNKFYAFINATLVQPYDLNSPHEKMKLKKEVFHHLFYGSAYVKQKAPVLLAFEREFPILAGLITQKKRYRKELLPIAMQTIEAEIVIARAAARLANKYANCASFCLISIHDCFVTTQEFVEEVKSVLDDEIFKKLGFNLLMDVKEFS
jgi:hypothetical protein